MIRINGKSIVKGIAIGRILKFSKKENPVKRTKITDAEAEVKRYLNASAQAEKQLDMLYQKALKEVGESGAAIFEIHSMMLKDDDYSDSIKNMIRTQEVNAEFAVASTSDNFSQLFASMDDEYMQARAADVRDISERLIRVLSGSDNQETNMEEPVIIMAEDLAPSETVQMDKEKLLAFVTRLGSSNSHTAILARTMNIPALINVEISDEWNGKTAIVDGYSGTLIIDPTDEVMQFMQDKQAEDIQNRKLLQDLKGKDNVTLDGQEIQVYANIGNVSDVAYALSNDAGGIGLFRSEFL